jgi:hypothetical protein
MYIYIYIPIQFFLTKNIWWISNCRVGSGLLPKALGVALRNLLSKRSKGFELAGFKKLFTNSIAV